MNVWVINIGDYRKGVEDIMRVEHYPFDKNSVFLVTGGAGFIGSNLVEHLLNHGYKVKCLDNLSTGKAENVEMFINNSNYTFINGDIRDFETCLKVCEGVDYVLHQAAWGSVPRSLEMPLLYEDINVKGTLNMMEASKINNVKKFVYASSSSVYGDEPNLPKREGFEGELLSPYAVTKKTNEYYGKLYKRMYNLDTYGLRYFNVFGRRQNPEGDYAAVLPKMIKQLISNQVPVIHGDGLQSRDFTYVDNVIDANIKCCIASSDAAGDVFNIASGGREYLMDVYNMLLKYLNKNVSPSHAPERKGDIKHSNADITKAKKYINYDPIISFEEGLKLSIDWYISEFSKQHD